MKHNNFLHTLKSCWLCLRFPFLYPRNKSTGKIQLISLLIGIIDGDGHISIDGKSITITAHKSWINFYTDLINKLKINFHIRLINNTNSIVISAGSKEVRKLLYDFIQNNKLTVLNRKWKRLKI